MRKYVESQEKAVQIKAEIMMDHFQDYVISKGKIGGQARAMVVTSSIERAIQYYYSIENYLQKRRSAYKAIVAFSGEYDYGGKKVNCSQTTAISYCFLSFPGEKGGVEDGSYGVFTDRL